MKLLGIIFLFLASPFSNAQQLKEKSISMVPSIEASTELEMAAKIVFEYDTAGNQINITYKVNTSSDIFQSKESNTAAFGQRTSIEIYPNPASQRVKIVGDFSEVNKIVAIRLIATVTRVAKKLEFESLRNRAIIDVSQFPTGVYILEIVLKDGAVLKHEFIKI
jgi:hypothetical protein